MKRRVLFPLSLRVEATVDVKATFARLIQQEGEPEKGGLLFGEIYPEQSLVRVTGATVPGPYDRATRLSWTRDKKSSNEKIARVWRESGGTVNYVGEWHTHPTDYPVPSLLDELTIRRLYARATLVADVLLMVIVGRKALWCGYWCAGRHGEFYIAWEDGSEAEEC